MPKLVTWTLVTLAALAAAALAAAGIWIASSDPRLSVEVRPEGPGPRIAVSGFAIGTPRAEVVARHGPGVLGFFDGDDGRSPVMVKEEAGPGVRCWRGFHFDEEGRLAFLVLEYEGDAAGLERLRGAWTRALRDLERKGEWPTLGFEADGRRIATVRQQPGEGPKLVVEISG